MMISEYLQRDYVLGKLRSQRDKLVALEELLASSDPKDRERGEKLLAHHAIEREQLTQAVMALNQSIERAQKNPRDQQEAAYIPTDAITCALQAHWTREAIEQKRVVPSATEPVRRSVRPGVRPAVVPVGVDDASPPMRLAQTPTISREGVRRATLGGFVENDDLRYGLDGFWSKLGGLFRKRRTFNGNPARRAISSKPLRIFIFGDWGTGLPLAAQVIKRIREQIDASDDQRQTHVIHLGDVYYVGEPDEYNERMLNLWPVKPTEAHVIGSWSLNGNHDMYSGGHGYFDTLLMEPRFFNWHSDKEGHPSSFFLIENDHWQIFGLDTSWQLPSLSETVFGEPTIADYGGQNGVLTADQVAWMKLARDRTKGAVLLTHHQSASSRKGENQHSDEAVQLLQQAGLYEGLDAWIWGHEHRAVVFKPKAERVDFRLASAPPLCACVGHAGVPVPEKNFGRAERKPDVAWEEDRLGGDAPRYEGKRIVPFGFARIDTGPDTLDFRIFDHRGTERFALPFRR